MKEFVFQDRLNKNDENFKSFIAFLYDTYSWNFIQLINPIFSAKVLSSSLR